MKRCPSTLSVAIGLLLGLAASAAAIEIRNYVAARHDRFTEFPAASAWNATAWYPSHQFTGVGWARDDTPYCRQFALVSPLHLVCATHYQPLPGTVMRFLNSDGVTVDRSVALLTPITNELDQNTDLTLVTLSSPLLPADKVTPFPYLNLGDENEYLGTPLTVFGWQTKVGKGVLSMFDDLTANGLPNTRLMGFAYPIASGGQDDVYLEIGDSGSPTFAMVGDTPALLGTHTAIDANATTRFNFDTFVPHYIAQLNAAMAADGHQMTPVYPLEVAAAPTPSIWRKATPGNCRFDIKNVTARAVTHLTVTLNFPAASAPDSLTAPGWIITPGTPGEYALTLASLSAATTDSITAAWLDLGVSASLAITLSLAADDNPLRTFNFNQTLAPSYKAWAAGLSNNDMAADPDGDGIPNLLEYAFGGDPAVTSQTMPSGAALLPALNVSGSGGTLSFPVRDDAALRGLTYDVEFSATLETGSWSLTPPPGYAVVDAPFNPAVPGHLLRCVSFAASDPAHFCRVRVELNE
ncbi:MAG: hypothetical protein WCP45_06330 [Verrucomicrobiota bacterium]